MLKGTSFVTRDLNRELGVVEISNTLKVEHATFRTEKYAFSGVHLPNNVKFIDDLKIDAQRRDFTCNALYYDVLGEELIDPFNGFYDIKRKHIKTTLNPDKVFKEDGERILRMVRLACTLGFGIEDDTYNSAINNVRKLSMLSSTRKQQEFSEIILADAFYPFLPNIKDAHVRGILMLAEIGALPYLLPSLEFIRVNNIIDDTGKNLFVHIINVFSISTPEVRLSALMHDVGKAYTLVNFNNFEGNKEIGSVLIEKDLGQEGLYYSKKIVERVKNVVFNIDFNNLGFENAKNIRRFIVSNFENIELIISLKKAISLEKNRVYKKSFGLRRIEYFYNKMIKTKTPVKISDLMINGNDIVETIPNINRKSINILFEKLLNKCINNPKLNTKEKLTSLTIKIVNKNKKVFMEV